MSNRNKRLNWKFRLFIFFISWSIAMIISISLNIVLDYEFGMKVIIYQALCFGILFGLILPYFFNKYEVKLGEKMTKNIIINLSSNEKIEQEAPANLFRGIEAVGGKLFLTNERLIFKSHRINIQAGEVAINLDEISEVIKRKTAKIIDNGMRVKTANEKEYDFVVNNREEWLEKLNGKRSS